MSAWIPFAAPRQSPPAVEFDAARWEDVERALFALPSVAAYRARDMGARLSLIAGASTFCAVAALPFVDGAVGFLAHGPELDHETGEVALRPYVAIRRGEAALITERGLVGSEDDVRLSVRACVSERVGIC